LVAHDGHAALERVEVHASAELGRGSAGTVVRLFGVPILDGGAPESAGLGEGLLASDAGFDAAGEIELHPLDEIFLVAADRGEGAERRTDFGGVVGGETVEFGRHDAGDGEGMSVKRDALPDDVSIALESALPEAVAQNHGVGVIRGKDAADEGTGAQLVE